MKNCHVNYVETLNLATNNLDLWPHNDRFVNAQGRFASVSTSQSCETAVLSIIEQMKPQKETRNRRRGSCPSATASTVQRKTIQKWQLAFQPTSNSYFLLRNYKDILMKFTTKNRRCFSKIVSCWLTCSVIRTMIFELRKLLNTFCNKNTLIKIVKAIDVSSRNESSTNNALDQHENCVT